MMRIKTVLPLLTCLIHGQMRSPLALSSKERKGMFPKLKVQMERLLHYSDLEEIDKWYMDSLPQFTIIQTENEDNNVNSDALLKLLDNNDGAYTPTKVSGDFPIMAIEINIPNSFAELFYDAALRLETIRTLLWLKDEEKRLRNDESMLQVVRNTMTRLNEFSHECVLRQVNSDNKCSEIIKLRIMQLYFAIEHTYCKREEWRNYLENVCHLPLTLDEYCYQLWEGTPVESWRDAYNNLAIADVVVETPNLAQLTERPKLTTAADKFTKIVAPFCFEELPLIKALNPNQQAELIELIVKDACYAAAMLKYLGYFDRLKNVYQKKSNEEIISHCAKAVGCAQSSFKKYFYSMRTQKSYTTYERHNAQAFFDNGQIESDYNRVKESQ